MVGSLNASLLTGAMTFGEKATDYTAAGCTVPFYSPIKGQTPADFLSKLGSAYGVRRDPISGKSVSQFHQGNDAAIPDGTPLVPAADGYIWIMGCSRSYGEFLIIRHPNGASTLYAHLQKGSINPRDASGNPVPYPMCTTDKPPKTQWNAYAPGRVPVVGGFTPIGRSDSTGARVTGPHLHFEYSAGKIILGRKGMGGRLDGASCVVEQPPPASCGFSYCFDKCFSAYRACYAACPIDPLPGLRCMSACDETFRSCPSTTNTTTCTCTT